MKHILIFFISAVAILFSHAAELSLSNPWIKAVISPERGIHIAALEANGCNFGEFGFVRIYNSPAVDSLKKISGALQKESAGKVTFHIHGQEDILKSLEITGSFALEPDSAALSVDYQFRNTGKQVCEFGFTIQNFTGETNTANTYFYPLDKGVAGLKHPSGHFEQWFYTAISNWCGVISGRQRGVALVMTPQVQTFYSWERKREIPTLEWRFLRNTLEAGQYFKSTLALIPFAGLDKISGAGPTIVGALDNDKVTLYSAIRQDIKFKLYDHNGKVLEQGSSSFSAPGTLSTVKLKESGSYLEVVDHNDKVLARLDHSYELPKAPDVPEYVGSDFWYGYPRMKFKVNNCDAWIVSPSKALPGNPWSWCMEFPLAFTERCAALDLLAKGYHHAHIRVGNTFGNPQAQESFKRFYQLARKLGLSEKTALIGISRGGLYAYRFASENPEKVSVIYGDAPVCDFKSWPGGFGSGTGSKGDWKKLKKDYGFTSDDEAKAYKGNPVDILPVLAQHKIALIHVVGLDDKIVPPAENTDIIEARYKELGGLIKVIRRPGVEHHPHGLDDAGEVVEFIMSNNR